MAFKLSELLARWLPLGKPGNEPTDYQGLLATAPSVEGEYRQLVESQMHRWGLAPGVVAIGVVKNPGRQRRPEYVVELTLDGWDRDTVICVLLGLPLIESKMRKAIEALWIADVSTFHGVKVKAGQRLQEADASGELRRLIIALTEKNSELAGINSLPGRD